MSDIKKFNYFTSDPDMLFYFAMMEKKSLLRYMMDREIHGNRKRRILHPFQRSDMRWVEASQERIACSHPSGCELSDRDRTDIIDKLWCEVMTSKDPDLDPYLEIGAWRAIWLKNEWDYLSEEQDIASLPICQTPSPPNQSIPIP